MSDLNNKISPFRLSLSISNLVKEVSLVQAETPYYFQWNNGVLVFYIEVHNYATLKFSPVLWYSFFIVYDV